MLMSHGKTFMTVLTLVGMVTSLNWPAVVQAGGGGELCIIGQVCSGVEPITVEIEIKPGEDLPSINPRSNGKLPVTVLSTETFDATTVVPETVVLVPFDATVGFLVCNLDSPCGADPVNWTLEDVNGDGRPDLLLHFRTQDIGIQCGDTTASISGVTSGGLPIIGTDTFQTVGCYGK
jgi:hypothetical protein